MIRRMISQVPLTARVLGLLGVLVELSLLAGIFYVMIHFMIKYW